MKKYIGKRIINFLIVLVGVSILSFLLIAWSGKDPAEIISICSGVSNPTPEQIEMIRVEMGLDQPLPVRYIQWLSGMFTGELGRFSIGRTDFPTGNLAEMRASLSRLAALEGEYLVYPGHGGPTTLQKERENNPYLGQSNYDDIY